MKQIKSSIIISNHISYLDPILYISIFPEHKTIVKRIFFKIPVMGWIMKSSGYIPFIQKGEYDNTTMKSLNRIPEFIKGGGNLFIFPEGTRSRNGRIGKFQKGAFSISGRYNLPLQVIYIKNTNRLFAPGKFFFNTCIKNTISVERLATIYPDGMTAIQLRDKAAEIYKNKMKDNE